MNDAKGNAGAPTDQGRAAGSEWRARLLLVLFSLFLTALFLEIALRLLGLGAPPALGKNAFDYFTWDAELGWELRPGAEGRLKSEEFDVAIRVNSRGERADAEIPVERTPGKRRLLVIGDSFSFGHGVEATEAWPALLEGLLSESEVVNLSVTGYGTDQQVLRLEKRGLAYKPDVVLLGLFEGNVFRNVKRQQMGYPKPQFVLRGGQLELTGVPLPELADGERYEDAMPFSRLWAFAGERGVELFRHLGYGESWPLTGAILDRFAADCRRIGAEPRVVLIPKDRAVDTPGWRGAIHRRTLRQIDELSRGRGIATLDLTSPLAAALEQDGKALYFPVDGHWNVAGHAVAARAVASWLMTE